MDVGTLVKTDKSEFIELNPYINFTSLPRKEGKLFINVYSDEKKSDKPADAPKKEGVTEGIPF